MHPETEPERAQPEVGTAVRKWRLASLISGLALTCSVALVIPFLYGQPFHALWSTLGVGFLGTSMALLIVFMYSAATTLNMCLDGADCERQTVSIAGIDAQGGAASPEIADVSVLREIGSASVWLWLTDMVCVVEAAALIQAGVHIQGSVEVVKKK